MKRSLTFLIAGIALVGLASFTNFQNTKLALKFTLIALDGETRIVDVKDMRLSDWQQEINSADFFFGEEEVFPTGMVVFSPIEGDAVVINCTDKATFIRTFKGIQKTYKIGAKDRIIIDNLVDKSKKVNYAPLVYSIIE